MNVSIDNFWIEETFNEKIHFLCSDYYYLTNITGHVVIWKKKYQGNFIFIKNW